MKISPARVAAFNVLLRIETEKSFSSILLPVFENELSPADRSLCHELVLGTLRRQIYLDKLIEHYSKGKKLDAAVRIALRLGLYQILFLDRIPEYSAVNESVSLVQLAKKTSAKGFVNAVLRRAAKEKIEFTFLDEVERLSVESSHPRWLIEKWVSEFGFEYTAELAAANNKVGKHAFRLLGNSSANDTTARQSEFVNGCYLTDQIDGTLINSAEKSEIYFQDEGSQMIACAIRIPDGGSFLDVCAAPGGKTGLVVRRNRSNIKIAVAGDLHWQRASILRDNCLRQGVEKVNVVQYDAEKPLPFNDNSFDVVLVDSPCSGTGTIRHNPELRYFLTMPDIFELSAKQLRILANASKMVRRGGSLIYSTCSLEREENEMVCEKFMNENPDFRAMKSNVQSRFITEEGFARTFPHRDDVDGFFFGEFRKE